MATFPLFSCTELVGSFTFPLTLMVRVYDLIIRKSLHFCSKKVGRRSAKVSWAAKSTIYRQNASGSNVQNSSLIALCNLSESQPSQLFLIVYFRENWKCFHPYSGITWSNSQRCNFQYALCLKFKLDLLYI